ncbi:hypothetical protein Calab_0547 [Caldithrix abyssi DSM 13497]|uniref:Capsule assembly protein Wzi n=1 Tax=Caldithrix abyssi DSM 13497 TaxID=880073 RepID=H1XRN8_CALAY|nr:capsule assembly Wzi family protein [Caldithrix abyssi]APF20128.1 hypothetical protein Cabys_3380 [Caldithrix abyssi DSM 13497]EHO40191.1 hypothetical protein Calab_0547 [Caldithrix abyssi DSM 13497]
MNPKFFLIVYCVFLPYLLFSQKIQSYVPLDDGAYHYINYQITRGAVAPYFILNQPYRFHEMFQKQNSKPASYFHTYYKQYFAPRKANLFVKALESVKWNKALLNRYRLDGGVYFTNAYLTLVNQTTVDQEFKYDANFAGDLSEADHWLYGRVNEAYADFHQEKFNIFYGRTHRNWGPLGEYGLILSNNPYTYDHLLIALNLKRIKFSLIYAQLDEYQPVFSYKNPDPPVQNVRRNLIGHRLDIHVSDRFQFALTEMATYGGENRPFEWAFLNPMNFYYPIQRNDKKQMDGFWCVDVFWKPFEKTAIWGQFLVDDIIVNNDPGIDDRGRYPDRLGILASFRQADWLINGTLWSLTYVRIWNRTYQSKFSWENYHYRGYGLGYPAPGLEEFKVKIDIWRYFPFYVSNESIYGRYGSVSVTDLFPLIKEPFPLAPVTYNFINHLKLRYYASNRLRLFSDIWYRKEPVHYSNRYAERGNWVVKLGFQYLANFSFGID